jgi:hypothetical protein
MQEVGGVLGRAELPHGLRHSQDTNWRESHCVYDMYGVFYREGVVCVRHPLPVRYKLKANDVPHREGRVRVMDTPEQEVFSGPLRLPHSADQWGGAGVSERAFP